MPVNRHLQRSRGLFLITHSRLGRGPGLLAGGLLAAFALLGSGCAGPAAAEGKVRYRGQKQVLAVQTTEPHVIVTSRPPPLGPAGDRDRGWEAGDGGAPEEVPAVIDPLALGRLVAELDDVGLFQLPSRPAVGPEEVFPAFAIEVDVEVEGAGPRRAFVPLSALKTGEQADVFARAAGAIVQAAGRR